MKSAIEIGFFVTALLCAAIAADARADTESLTDQINPARCKTGNRAYVYWAAKDQVFRFKYDPAHPIHRYPESKLTVGMHFDAKQEIPPAPNPAEPLGCYGNPLRALEIPYMDAFDAELFQKLAGRKLDFGVRMRGFYALPTNYFESSVQEKIFRGSNNCWKRTSGIHECLLVNAIGKERTDYDITHALRIGKDLLPKNAQVSDVYASISLLGPLAPNGQKWLAVDSKILLFGNVLLESNFRIFSQEIDLLIPYYSGLIRYVLNAHVSNYQWTSSKTK